MSFATSQSQHWNVASPQDARRIANVGSVVVAGAIAYVLHIVARSMLTSGPDPVTSATGPLWVPVNALGVIGAVLVLIGLPAISRRLSSRLEHAGLALVAISWTFFGTFLSLHGALIQPWLAEEAPRLIDGSTPTPAELVVAYAIALLAWLAGATLLAIPFVKGRAKPRWIGYLLPFSAAWFMIGSFVIAPDGPASNFAVNLLSNLGPVLLLVALGWLGTRTWVNVQSE